MSSLKCERPVLIANKINGPSYKGVNARGFEICFYYCCSQGRLTPYRPVFRCTGSSSFRQEHLTGPSIVCNGFPRNLIHRMIRGHYWNTLLQQCKQRLFLATLLQQRGGHCFVIIMSQDNFTATVTLDTCVEFVFLFEKK